MSINLFTMSANKNNYNQKPRHNVCLKNVPRAMSADEIRRLCADFGNVEDINDKAGPFVFVRMGTLGEAEKVIQGLKDNKHGILAELCKPFGREKGSNNQTGERRSREDHTTKKHNDSNQKLDTSSVNSTNKIPPYNPNKFKNQNKSNSELGKNGRNIVEGAIKCSDKENNVDRRCNENRNHSNQHMSKRHSDSVQSLNIPFSRNDKKQPYNSNKSNSPNWRNRNFSGEHTNNVQLSPATKPDNVICKGLCQLCRKVSNQRCQRCGDFYCSTQCQSKDWPVHRYFCNPMPKLVDQDSTDIGITVEMSPQVPPLQSVLPEMGRSQTQNVQPLGSTSKLVETSRACSQTKPIQQAESLRGLEISVKELASLKEGERNNTIQKSETAQSLQNVNKNIEMNSTSPPNSSKPVEKVESVNNQMTQKSNCKSPQKQSIPRGNVQSFMDIPLAELEHSKKGGRNKITQKSGNIQSLKNVNKPLENNDTTLEKKSTPQVELPTSQISTTSSKDVPSEVVANNIAQKLENIQPPGSLKISDVKSDTFAQKQHIQQMELSQSLEMLPSKDILSEPATNQMSQKLENIQSPVKVEKADVICGISPQKEQVELSQSLELLSMKERTTNGMTQKLDNIQPPNNIETSNKTIDTSLQKNSVQQANFSCSVNNSVNNNANLEQKGTPQHIENNIINSNVEAEAKNKINTEVNLKASLNKDINLAKSSANVEIKVATSNEIVNNKVQDKNETKTHSDQLTETFPKSGSTVCLTSLCKSNYAYIRVLEEGDGDAYLEILNRINVEGKTAKRLEKLPEVGEVVITDYQNVRFCRAKVFFIRSEENIAITYLDFGNIQFKKLSELKEIKKDLIHLRRSVYPVFLKDVPDFPLKETLMKFVNAYIDNFYEFKLMYEDISNVELLDTLNNTSLNQKIVEFDNSFKNNKILQDPPVMAKDIVMNLLPNGEYIPVYVSDNSLMETNLISCVHESFRAIVDENNKEFDAYARKVNEPHAPRLSEICLAEFDEDGNWYRAECIEIEDKENISVTFIDMGNFANVHVSKIRKYPRELTRPCHTSSCVIADLPADELDQKVADRLKQLIPVNAKIIIDKIETLTSSQANVIHLKNVVGILKSEKLL